MQGNGVDADEDNDADTGDWSTLLNDPQLFYFSQSSELQDYSDNAGSPNSLSNIDTEDLFKPENQSIGETRDSVNTTSRSSFSSLTSDSSHFSTDNNLTIEFEATKKLTKSTAWTYSESLKKLFVDIGKSFPVKFRTTFPVPGSSVISCTALYSQAQYRNEVVRRCPNHLAVMEKGSPAPSLSFVRCDHKASSYRCDPTTGHWTVSVTCDPSPRDHPLLFTVAYRMMCFTSCVGGINRRPVELLFTLKDTMGKILDQCRIELRVCACPGRDRLQEEQHNSSPMASGLALTPSCETGVKRPIKKPLGSDAETRVYTVEIKGYKNYKILKRLAEALETSDEVSAAKKIALKKEEN